LGARRRGFKPRRFRSGPRTPGRNSSRCGKGSGWRRYLASSETPTRCCRGRRPAHARHALATRAGRIAWNKARLAVHRIHISEARRLRSTSGGTGLFPRLKSGRSPTMLAVAPIGQCRASSSAKPICAGVVGVGQPSEGAANPRGAPTHNRCREIVRVVSDSSRTNDQGATYGYCDAAISEEREG
jgi:hypothetical protein